MTNPVAVFLWGKLRHCEITGLLWSTAAQLQPPRSPCDPIALTFPRPCVWTISNGEAASPTQTSARRASAWIAPDVTVSKPGALLEC